MPDGLITFGQLKVHPPTFPRQLMVLVMPSGEMLKICHFDHDIEGKLA